MIIYIYIYIYIYTGIHINYSLFLSYFRETLIFSTDFEKILMHEI
jgi:hypothetical protein